MVDVVFYIRNPGIDESMVLVKIFQPGLRADADCLQAPPFSDGIDGALHQVVPQAAAPCAAARDYPAYAGLTVLDTGAEAARVGNQMAIEMAQIGRASCRERVCYAV